MYILLESTWSNQLPTEMVNRIGYTMYIYIYDTWNFLQGQKKKRKDITLITLEKVGERLGGGDGFPI